MAYRGLKKIATGAVHKYGAKQRVNAGTLAEFKTLVTSGDVSAGIKAGDVFMWNELPAVAAVDFIHDDQPVTLYTDGVWVLKNVLGYAADFERGELIFVGCYDDDTGQTVSSAPFFCPDPYYNATMVYGRYYCVGTVMSDGVEESEDNFSISVAIGFRSFAQIVEEVEQTPLAAEISPLDDEENGGGEEVE